jgi:hypothetical protein
MQLLLTGYWENTNWETTFCVRWVSLKTKVPVVGEMYRIQFSEFRNVFNKLPLYDGETVVTH